MYFYPLFANQDMKGIIDFFEARMIIESEASSSYVQREDPKKI